MSDFFCVRIKNDSNKPTNEVQNKKKKITFIYEQENFNPDTLFVDRTDLTHEDPSGTMKRTETKPTPYPKRTSQRPPK